MKVEINGAFEFLQNLKLSKIKVTQYISTLKISVKNINVSNV